MDMLRELPIFVRRPPLAACLALLFAAAAAAQSTKVSAPSIPSGDVRSFRWSADGDWLVYVADADQDEVDELYSVALGAGNAVTKLNPPLVAGGDVSSTTERLRLSADSQWAVYLADQDVVGRRELFRVALDGTPAALKLSHALGGNATLQDFEIDPNSLWIVYRAFRNGLLIADLHNVRLDASQGPTALTNGGSVVGYRISPDGARVVLEVGERLYGASVAGGAVHGLSASGTTIGRFEFAPVGQWLVWDTPFGSLHDTQRLWGARTDGAGNPFVLGDSFWADHDHFRFEFAATGTRVVYISDSFVDGRFDLHSIVGRPLWRGFSLGGYYPSVYGTVRFQHEILALDVGDGVAGGIDFHISPDGRRVAYLAGVGADPELYSIPIKGVGGPLALTSDVALVRALRFSPDSARVVYLAELEGAPGTTRLFSVPADGSASPVELSGAFVAGGEIDTSGLAEPFALSPDSTRVVYRADQDTDDVFELYARALDGSGSPVKLNGPLTSGGNVGGSLGTAVTPAFVIRFDSSAVVYAADQDQDEVFELYTSSLP